MEEECKKNAIWYHLSRLKVSAFFCLKKKFVVKKGNIFYLGLVTQSNGWWSPMAISKPTIVTFIAETVKNALAYHTKESITPVKSFIE